MFCGTSNNSENLRMFLSDLGDKNVQKLFAVCSNTSSFSQIDSTFTELHGTVTASTFGPYLLFSPGVLPNYQNSPTVAYDTFTKSCAQLRFCFYSLFWMLGNLWLKAMVKSPQQYFSREDFVTRRQHTEVMLASQRERAQPIVEGN